MFLIGIQCAKNRARRLVRIGSREIDIDRDFVRIAGRPTDNADSRFQAVGVIKASHDGLLTGIELDETSDGIDA